MHNRTMKGPVALKDSHCVAFVFKVYGIVCSKSYTPFHSWLSSIALPQSSMHVHLARFHVHLAHFNFLPIKITLFLNPHVWFCIKMLSVLLGAALGVELLSPVAALASMF